MNITPRNFLDAVFDGKQEDEHVLLTHKRGEKWSTSAADDKGLRYMKSKKPCVYFCVSSVRETGETFEDGGRIWRRNRDSLIAAYVIVLDDIGTKVSDQPPVEPSYKLESSKGNFQWGYLIQPTEMLDRYEAIVEALGDKGWTDKGAGGSYRVMRVPGSLNDKPGKDNFISTITAWNPDRSWDMDDLAVKLGVDVENLNVVRKTAVQVRTGGSSIDHDLDVEDPLLTWLQDEGHIVTDKGEWVDVVCPWHEKHTTGSNTAGYSPLGRGDGRWGMTRGFKCQHEHCIGKGFKDFRDWAVSNGGPVTSGYDPLPFVQGRWVYLVGPVQFADMFQRPLGGNWVYTEKSFDNNMAELGQVMVPNHNNAVTIKKAMLENGNTRKAENIAYLPGQGEVGDMESQAYVNTYLAPQHTPTEEVPKVFLEHMAFILPEESERELFIDWLAYKIQNPASRSYAIVMVANNAYGVGRSWISDMLRAVVGDQLVTASLKQLIGKGTSAENTYNDWAAQCQFMVIEEAKDVSKEEFWDSYQVFKQRIDARPTKFTVNPKFGQTRTDFMYFNCLIFSNHTDALALPEGDRRVAVLTNPTQRRDDEYYDRLWRSVNEGEPARLYWYLKRRDVSKFDATYPPDTEAKMKMIEMSRSPAEDIERHIRETADGDLITQNGLRVLVTGAARELGHDKIQQAPGGVSNHIWKALARLRSDKKFHGARYSIDGGQHEVRALRNADLWRGADEDREKDKIVAEVQKNTGSVVQFPTIKAG